MKGRAPRPAPMILGMELGVFTVVGDDTPVPDIELSNAKNAEAF